MYTFMYLLHMHIQFKCCIYIIVYIQDVYCIYIQRVDAYFVDLSGYLTLLHSKASGQGKDGLVQFPV